MKLRMVSYARQRITPRNDVSIGVSHRGPASSGFYNFGCRDAFFEPLSSGFVDTHYRATNIGLFNIIKQRALIRPLFSLETGHESPNNLRTYRRTRFHHAVKVYSG